MSKIRDTPRADPFGPTLAYASEIHMDTGVEPDKLVATHCCFCGQQCGMLLKVKDNQVIGVEPCYDFPFNQGKLCPKGIKRYLQNGHPDRLLHAYRARRIRSQAVFARSATSRRLRGSPPKSTASRRSMVPMPLPFSAGPA